MLLAVLSLFQSLFPQALTHSTVHIITRPKEPQDIVLRVALPQLSYQLITLVRVQVR